METRGRILVLGLIAPLLCGPARAQIEGQEITYGVEYGGKLCGYSQFQLSRTEADGQELLLLEQKFYVMLSLLGAQFDSELDFTYRIDPATGRFVHHTSRIRQGEMDLGMELCIDGLRARMSSPQGGEERIVELPPDAILPNTLLFPYILADFGEGGVEEKTYEVFDVREGAVQPVTWKKVGEERLELSDSVHDTIVFLEENPQTGVRIRRWLDRESGQVLKTLQPNGMTITLADASVIGRIELANVDRNVLTPTNRTIREFRKIVFMRVHAALEPTGLRPTPESLCVPGQSFEGTVQGNRIEGVFEVSQPIYAGAAAPPFPADWSDRPELRPYLEAEDFIEADDPVLVEATRNITEGASDCWDAAGRIGRWVADNIHGALPGGMTARTTYDIRKGECAAHSFLTAALCRAAGIPTRVVWGCMYIPKDGGCFGQHVWNEVYMGEAGWIPLDTTVREPDFVDSGHIRIGVFRSRSTALNGLSFEILEHRITEG